METVRMKMAATKYIFVMCVACIFMSCNHSTIFHQYTEIDPQGWNHNDPAVFYVDVKDIDEDYDVIIDIRNQNEYPYQNLYLFVESMSPDSVIVSDTLNCILADNQGKWYGSGIGSTSNLPILYMQNIRFPKEGTYSFYVRQGMRDTDLKGIVNIGMRIGKTLFKENNQ